MTTQQPTIIYTLTDEAPLLATSAFLTLEVLPVLYTIWRHRQLRRSQRTAVPLEAIVGSVPEWARA